MRRLRAIAFDSVETCLRLDALRPRLLSLGLLEGDLELWFARSLRDGFALEVTGAFHPFREVLAGNLAVLLESRGLERQVRRIDDVIESFSELPLYPDVQPALELVRERGGRALLLTNASEAPTRKAMEQAGVMPLIEGIVSIDSVRHFKPAREVYLAAVNALGLEAEQVALIAAHAWDVHGARQAGLATGFVRRGERLFPRSMAAPDARGDSLVEVVRALL